MLPSDMLYRRGDENMKKKRWLPGGIGVITALVLSLSPVSAQAIPDLDFNIAPPSPGTISYAGGVNPLVGTDIGVDTVIGENTPANNNAVRNCIGCGLDFTTGNLTGSDATHWFFGGGGTITLTGGIDLNHDGDVADVGVDVLAGSTIFTGSFNSAEVVSESSNFRVAIAMFIDTKDPTLLDFYGLPVGIPYDGNFNISFMATGTPPDAFTSSSIKSGDIVNIPTPEPTSLLLLGTGLVSLGFIGRNRKRWTKTIKNKS